VRREGMLACPSEFSALLLGPCRYRREPSSYGIGCSFRVFDPQKHRRYWFDDPAVPLAVAPAVRFSSHGRSPTTFKVAGSILSSNLPFL